MLKSKWKLSVLCNKLLCKNLDNLHHLLAKLGMKLNSVSYTVRLGYRIKIFFKSLDKMFEGKTFSTSHMRVVVSVLISLQLYFRLIQFMNVAGLGRYLLF